MICPITDKPCRTNGCGEKCYKRDSLGYSTAPQHDAKLPVSGQLPPLQVTDKEYKKLMKALYPKDRSKKFRR